LIAAGAAGGVYVLRRSTPAPRRASWDVPLVQQQQAERLAEASALYQAGRDQEARILLRDRALDWQLIRSAAAAQPLDPTARRIAQTLERDGVGMFLNDLHRLGGPQRSVALDTLVRALNDYTGPADTSGGS
jgi:hypothetical protein